MSAQVLNARSTRRLAALAGVELARAWAHGGTGGWFAFATTDHRHGAVQRPTGEVQWHDEPMHYSSCHELFPEWDAEQPDWARPGYVPPQAGHAV